MSDARDLLRTTDPVGAFVEAHTAGEPVVLGTSGTTGGGRYVVRTTTSWTDSFRHVTELTGIGPGSRLWVPGPVAATMNLFALVHARFAGAAVADDPTTATHLQVTPARLRGLLDQGVELAGRHAVVAGDRLPPALADRAADAGLRTSHYYGSAELSFVAWGRDASDLRPFPGVEVEVRDGTIWARSPYLCTGYRGGTGPLLRDRAGFATVGDRGALAGAGLVVHGRGDAAVTVGGATVQVADVEEALRPTVRGDVVAVGLPHDQLGQVLAVALTDPTDFAATRAAARTALHGAARPRRWFAVDELPLTPAGKLDRTALVRALVSREPGVRVLT